MAAHKNSRWSLKLSVGGGEWVAKNICAPSEQVSCHVQETSRGARVPSVLEGPQA